MIFVDRRKIPVPKIFSSKEVAAAQSEARQFFDEPHRARDQQRHEFNTRLWWQFTTPAKELFSSKCAYCETRIRDPENLKAGVNLFRPAFEVVGSNSLLRNDGYWWLAYDWSNCYLACDNCQRNKQNHFPIFGKRARPDMRGAALRREQPLLLDPCFDLPEDYLLFNPGGTVDPVPSTQGKKAHERASTTIEILGLNRPQLVKERLADRNQFMRYMPASAPHQASESVSGLVMNILSKEATHAAYRRALFLELAPKYFRDLEFPLSDEHRRQFDLVSPGFSDRVSNVLAPSVLRRRRRPAQRSRRLKQTPAIRFGSLASVTLENFRAIRHLSLELPTSTEHGGGWKVVLGENGSGKSSILQAIAFALMGPAYMQRCLKEARRDSASLLRKYSGKRSTSSGLIRLGFTTGAAIAVHIKPGNFSFNRTPPDDFFLRGYGATRLLARGTNAWQGAFPGERVARDVHTMFEPAQPVFDANAWLTRLRRSTLFGTVALALKDLLGLPGMTKLHQRNRNIYIPMDGLAHPLSELSAGFESVISMVVDIIAGQAGKVRDLRNATGLVLIDEIDAHLHPRWKMRIVDSLRKTFSSMQFIVTTHEPLCLRGVKEGEVVVLERNGREVSVLQNVPSPNSMRVDQLLTSNLFGLRSTEDPETEKQFRRYYELLAREPESLSDPERIERESLRLALGKYETRMMTSDPREELLYEALDEYLAKEFTLRGEARAKLPQLRDETKRKVAQLYREIARRPS